MGSSSVQNDGVTDRRPAGDEGAGGQLERVAGGLVPPGAGAGRDAVIGGEDGAAPVEEGDVEGRRHPPHVDRPAGPEDQALAGGQCLPAHQTAEAEPPAIGQGDPGAQDAPPGRIGGPDVPHPKPWRAWKIWINAGPRMTTNIAGKM